MGAELKGAPQPRRPAGRVGRLGARPSGVGQVLVLFVLFLLVLLGVSAIGIDYASWLLTDRYLQNVADHAALAGASAFEDSSTANDCSGTKCDQARIQAWTSLRDELKLVDDGGTPLDAAAIADLADDDSPDTGQPDGMYGSQNVIFRDTIWVSTPPPSYQAYVGVGGHYALNNGVVFVRVDRDVRSFIGGALGIQPQPRHGWATAGVQSTDFAMQIFCRTAIDPSCGGSGQAALVIDGGGGIRLTRGSIASNQSLKVTQQGGRGVIVDSGDVFVVTGDCGASSWNCPQSPATPGGIADDDPTATPNVANNKNVFYFPPQAVPQYQSPVSASTVSHQQCTGASATDLCVPNRPETGTTPGQPGDWSCSLTDLNNLCGQPCAYLPAFPTCVNPATLTPADPGYGLIRCDARIGGTPSRHLVPWGDGTGANSFRESPDQANGEDYKVLDDDATLTPPDPDTTGAANPPVDYIYRHNPLSGSGTDTVTYNLRPPFGIPQSGTTAVRYVAFKTDGTATLVADGNEISVSVALLQSGTTVYSEPADAHILTGTPTPYEFTVPANMITNYTTLSVRFTFHTTVDNGIGRAGGVAWAEAETPTLDPAIPPMIPPGYYHSITIPGDTTNHGCAILDPTAVYTGLKAYQMPGIYRFGGAGGASINIGNGGYLIGDGVTLVFDTNFPDATGSGGIILNADSALILNTALTPGAAGTIPCTPYAEAGSYNPSAPLIPLPYSALCASWGVDTSATSGVRVGANAWPYCDPVSTGGDLTLCRFRTLYNPTPDYRGITFYFTPAAWDGSVIRNRFEMGGTTAGLAFRGVLYAPFDDVRISGKNGFNTVGQVLAWTAKFNGGNAYINLDYPYESVPSSPYLLEPTVDH